MISYFVATEDRNLILQAMDTLMYAVGTPIPEKTARKTCVHFRPKQRGDRRSFKIVYGTGCSATVRNHRKFCYFFFVLIIILFRRLGIGQICIRQ